MVRKITIVIILIAAINIIFAQQGPENFTVIILDENGLPLPFTQLGFDKTNIVKTDGKGLAIVRNPKLDNAKTLYYTPDDTENYGNGSINFKKTGIQDTTITLKRKILSETTKSKRRDWLDSPVPLDTISKEQLRAYGQVDLAEALMYNIPAFNASQIVGYDAMAHMNPADLRGLSPSRTLILINGKRKNSSALVYTGDTHGKGEVGLDLSSIPTSAIERIDVIRDGASAQYGSDAIAGVINIILKDANKNNFTINYLTGSNKSELGKMFSGLGDGFTNSFDANYGYTLKNKGFINLTSSFTFQDYTSRTGRFFGRDENALKSILKDISPSAIKTQLDLERQDSINYPDGGMRPGQPIMARSAVFYNFLLPIGDSVSIYSFGGLTNRKGKSFAFFRLPSDKLDLDSIYKGNGYLPNFQTDILDNTFSLGLKREKKGDWQYDISLTYGKNTLDYTIGNTLNTSLGKNSPQEFSAGGHQYNQLVSNVDIQRDFTKWGLWSLGIEIRRENFKIIAGDRNSYTGNGAVSFTGYSDSIAGDFKRGNIGVYLESEKDWQINENLKFLANGNIRFEKYSDFGDNLTGKLTGRFLIKDQFVIRGGINWGFRAPSLQQTYFSTIDTKPIGNLGLQKGYTFNNKSPIIRNFDIPALAPEKSENINIGVAFKPKKLENFKFSLDGYQIKIRERIVFTGDLIADSITNVGKVISRYNVKSLNFFANAVSTVTKGYDAVIEYNIAKLGCSFALNQTFTQISKQFSVSPQLDTIKNSPLFSETNKAFITTSLPQTKAILSGYYSFSQLTINARATYFGSVRWVNGDGKLDMDFGAKVVCDANVSYQFTKPKITLSVGADNVLNSYPKELPLPTNSSYEEYRKYQSLSQFGKLKYARQVNQFGINGIFVYFKIGAIF